MKTKTDTSAAVRKRGISRTRTLVLAKNFKALASGTTLVALGCLTFMNAQTPTLETRQAAASAIFPQGEKAPSEFFTGDVTVLTLAKADGVNKYSVSNVVFTPGARTNWHTHPDGQILVVVAGRGCYQERGKPMRRLNAGDSVNIPAGIEHWHGAAPDSGFTHIALSNEIDGSAVTWLKPVSEAEYESAVSQK